MIHKDLSLFSSLFSILPFAFSYLSPHFSSLNPSFSFALLLSLSRSLALSLFHSLFSRSLHLTSSLTHAHVHTTDGMCVTYSGGILSRCIHPGGCDTWRGVTLCYDEYASESTSMQNTFSTCCCL